MSYWDRIEVGLQIIEVVQISVQIETHITKALLRSLDIQIGYL